MKNSLFFPVALILVFIFFVSAACNLPFSSKDVATEEPQVVVITATPETKESNVTSDEVVVEEDTTEDLTEDQDSEEIPAEDLTAADEPQPFYLEEFDDTLDNFSYDVIYGNSDPEKASIFNENGALKFEISDYDLYTYVYYDPYTYTDVRIDLEADNLATNDNSVTLFCRYDPDLGWYEYNIDNDGEWTLYYYDNVIAKNYIQLYDGGSTAINMGRDTNVYTMICQGRELSLYINGTFTHKFEHKDLKEGAVGLGVSSYDSYPVKINVNWLEISEP